MRVLFFFILVFVPFLMTAFSTDWLLANNQLAHVKQALFIPVVVFITVAYLFREKIIGRDSLPSIFSFEFKTNLLLSTGSAFCSLSGWCLITLNHPFPNAFAGVYFTLAITFALSGIALVSTALAEGPVYGWD